MFHAETVSHIIKFIVSLNFFTKSLLLVIIIFKTKCHWARLFWNWLVMKLNFSMLFFNSSIQIKIREMFLHKWKFPLRNELQFFICKFVEHRSSLLLREYFVKFALWYKNSKQNLFLYNFYTKSHCLCATNYLVYQQFLKMEYTHGFVMRI